MHLLGLVHKDIKPANILHSPSIGDLVLCDFGLSQPINEEVGEKTATYREGTARFMSPEMKGLEVGVPGFVDLYYNDLYGIRMTLHYSDNSDSQSSSEVSNHKVN